MRSSGWSSDVCSSDLQVAVDGVAVPASADALTEWGVGEYGRQQRANNGREFTWIHVGTDVVRLRTAGIGADTLTGFTIFQRDTDGNLLRRLDVGAARYADGLWQLSDITTTEGDGRPRRSARSEERRGGKEGGNT